MQAAPGHREAENMNHAIDMNQPSRTYPRAPGLTEEDTWTPRHDPRALYAVPLIGTAATAASAWTALLAAGVLSFLFTGNTDPHVRANAYTNAHFPDAYLAHNPLVLAACCILVIAATALAYTRRRLPAVLLLCAAAAMPWIPAIDFLHHVWQLAPVSTRG
jgi:hypothetical protein